MNTGFFDPAGMPRVWTVAALTRAIGDALAARFNPVAVAGEVTGFTRAASGHCYFTLKDDGGQLRCVIFRRAAMLLGFDVRDGDRVEARGRLAVYEARGSLQLIVESMQRAGQGALFEQFLRLKARLEAEGLFDPARKRPLPPMPRAIGVVTSPQAAALHDVCSTLARRAPQVPVRIAPASVQGSAAPAELCRALERLYERTASRRPIADAADPPIDLILLVRGGGSIEDLWAFNDEALARTVAASPVPVISGVGHETDFTIADFVADVRAPTPTGAAEMALAPREQWLAALAERAGRFERALRDRLDGATQHLDGLGARLGRPSTRVAAERLRVERLAGRVARAVERRLPEEAARLGARDGQLRRARDAALVQRRLRLDALAALWRGAHITRVVAEHERLRGAAMRLGLLDPRLVLERGYAWLQDGRGNAITHAAQADVGAELQAVLSDGSLNARVTARRMN